MVKVGKWIARHRILMLLIGVLLIIPSVIGIAKTKVNYDLLSYLPDHLETVKGQDILVDEFGMGAFSMVAVENMDMKDVQKLEKEFEKVPHVQDVLWYDDVADISLPTEMIPKDIRKAFINGDATMMLVLFDDTTSSDNSMEALTQLRKIANKQCFISGMTGIVTDIKNIAMKELPIYVVIAALLSLVVLEITSGSFVVPFFFLLSIGLAILYNLGSNIIFGETSYITQALTAVLQLGVTMDYSIFLLESYEANKERYEGDKKRAMAHAISNTFTSITASSITTVAGFVALCFMTFKLGTNIGIVMSKGVVIGVLTCVTVLPAMILTCDKAIEKTTHRSLIPSLDKLSHGIVKGRYVALLLFLIVLVPAIHGNNNYKIYYNIDQSLPKNIPSNEANEKLKKEFNMSNMHMILLKDGLSAKEKSAMSKEIEKVDGVKWVIGLNSLVGSNVPESMIPNDIKKMLKTDNYELEFVSSDYSSATDEVNSQLAKIDKIVKKYQNDGMVIGEAPMMKDLQDVTDVDLKTVNNISILAIFVIILITFKSISIPVILISVIEFAIACNMAVPFYTNTSLPFVASIVIGTIQLGATVDYAILMTSRYHKERTERGQSKKDAIRIAHETSIKSILTSGLCFFAATFGVSVYSQVDMIGSICTLLSRGAIISMIVVICVLPAMLWIFDGVIKRTSWNMIKANVAKRDAEKK